MKSIDKKLQKRYNRSIWQVIITMLITVFALSLISAVAIKYIKKNNKQFINSIYIEKTKNQVQYYDEVMSMSILMALETKEEKWIKRYYDFKFKLDSLMLDLEENANLTEINQSFTIIKQKHIFNSAIEEQTIKYLQEDSVQKAKNELENYKYNRLVKSYSKISTLYPDHDRIENFIEKLRSNILILDEVLTMSTMLYVSSGNEVWKNRYLIEEELLTAGIQGVLLLDNKNLHRIIHTIDSVNNELVELEYKSFDLVQANMVDSAKFLLISQKYNHLKDTYSKGIEALNHELDEIITSKVNRSKQNISAFQIITFFLVIFIIGLWFILVKTIKTFQSKLLDSNNRLVTEINQNEEYVERLQIERNNQNNLINTIPDFLYIKDKHGRYIDCNNTMLTTLGLEKNEIIGKTDFEVFPDGHAQKYTDDDKTVRTILKQLSVEDTLETNDKKFVFETKKTPFIYVENGKKEVGVLGISRDITIRKESEERLKFFTAAIEKSTNNIAITNVDGKIEYVNEGFVNRTGYSYKELIGNNPSVLNSGKHDESFFKELWGIINSGNVWEGEIYNKRKNGDYYWELATISPIKTKKGEITHFLKVAQDITQTKKYEQELGDSRKFLQLITDSIPVNISYVNKNLEYEFVNNGYVQWLNKSKEDVIGKKVEAVLGEKIFEDIYPNLFKALEGETVEYEKVFLSDDNSESHMRTIYVPHQKDTEVNGIFIARYDITEIRKTEKELKKNKERLSLALLGSNSGVWEWNIKTSTVYFDPNYFTMAGYEPNEFPHSYEEWKKRVHPEDIKLVEKKIEEYIRGNIKEYKVEFRFLKKNEEWMWILASGRLFEKDSKGRPLRFSGMHVDITERKNIEIALHKSEEKFRSIFENSPMGILLVNDEDKPFMINNTAVQMFGYSIEELTSKTFKNVTHPDDLEKDILLNEEITSGKRKNFSIEKRYITKKGETIYCKMNGTVFLDELGKYMYSLVVLADITENKEKEKQIQEKETQLRQIIKHMPFAIAMFDNAMKYIQVNDEWFKMYNLPKRDIIHKSHYEVFPEIGDDWKKIHQRCLNGEISKSDSSPFPRLDNTIDWIRWDVRPWRKVNNEVGGLIMYTEVITEKKQMELDLVAAKDIAEEANLAKSRFLANMSHEIRTPLNSILGFSQLLQNQDISEEQKNYVGSILTSGRGLLLLIDDILDLSKIESGKLELQNEYTDLRYMVNEVNNIFYLMGKQKGIEFSIKLDEDIPPSLYLDETRLRQVLVNLIGNAIKFTFEGYVEILIEGKKTKAKGTNKLINLKITINDTGIGIKEESLKVIFEAFSQGNSKEANKYGGTGLGLSISKQLISLMNGEIEVTSKVGKGTNFTITIPRIPYLEKRVKREDGFDFKFKDVQFEQASLLIVDDNENNRKYIFDAVKNKGLEIYLAEDVEQAVDVLNRTKIDLIITDLRMPEKTGFDLLKYIKSDSRFTDIKVIASSASSLKKDYLRQIYRFEGFLMKPVNLNDLYMELTKFLKVKTNEKEHIVKEPTKIQRKSQPIIDKESLINELDNDLRLKWQVLKEQPSLNDSKVFAEKLTALAKKHNTEILNSYTNDILKAIEQFDIEQILICLMLYETIIETIKKQ